MRKKAEALGHGPEWAEGRAAAAMANCSVTVLGREIFRAGRFLLTPALDAALSDEMRAAELGEPGDGGEGGMAFPKHERCVDVEVVFAGEEGEDEAGVEEVVFGSDLTHGYVSENADYRS